MSFAFLVAGRGFEPPDLRVMSPTSYQAALPCDIFRLQKVLYHKYSLLSTPFLIFSFFFDFFFIFFLFYLNYMRKNRYLFKEKQSCDRFSFTIFLFYLLLCALFSVAFAILYAKPSILQNKEHHKHRYCGDCCC